MSTEKALSTYEQQAVDFLESHDITFRAVFLMHGKHFDGDKETRDIYECILERQGKAPMSIRFGQSINKSHYTPDQFNKMGHFKHLSYDQRQLARLIGYPCVSAEWLKSTMPNGAWERKQWNATHIADKKAAELKPLCVPTAYDILACLTKSNPGSFDDFCHEYGYDTDSRSAERTYRSVVDEWLKVSAFFTTSEIEELQEIQ